MLDNLISVYVLRPREMFCGFVQMCGDSCDRHHRAPCECEPVV